MVLFEPIMEEDQEMTGGAQSDDSIEVNNANLDVSSSEDISHHGPLVKSPDPSPDVSPDPSSATPSNTPDLSEHTAEPSFVVEEEATDATEEAENGEETDFDMFSTEDAFKKFGDEYDYETELRKFLEGDYSYAEEETEEEEEEEEEEIMPEEEGEEFERILIDKYDRNKLIMFCKKLTIDRNDAERKRVLLNRKLLDYCKRRKLERALADDNPDHVPVLKKKLEEALIEYDSAMALEETVSSVCDKLIKEINTSMDKILEEKTNNVQTLNKRLKDIGITLQSSESGLPLQDRAVDAMIRRMNNIRNIISEERLLFIKAQDYMTEIDHKAKSLEDLGNGLRMIDFEQLRAETQSLSDKIEERNNELIKLRIRCYSDTQILAHIREKEYMLGRTIMIQTQILNRLQEDAAENRTIVNELKLKRDGLRRKYTEMSEECGLLDKQTLLRDYDRTSDEIKKLSKQVAILQAENEEIDQEIYDTMMKIDDNMIGKSSSTNFDEALHMEIADQDRPTFPRVRRGVPYVRSFFAKQEYRNNESLFLN